MERARKEAEKEYDRERNRVLFLDGLDEHMRDLLAAERRRKQIKALELKIRELKERKKRVEESSRDN
ncbi:hypothetical protein FNV43_RR14258 [Rhamnella rubrinervis]|uniref:Uncharacterized protein n=1 Tax=Rhamnella rubrinervis TaxID=2594499 RepID=A0A8K0H2K5_9ROSA|nr:hypothetical protein FNV43_RR14258 [Rhamnella rubrinervis]